MGNSALRETTAHESGHAFDFALALETAVKNEATSQTVAFKGLVVADLRKLNTLPTCQLFGRDVTTSMLELNLGADTLSAVCDTSGNINRPYQGLSNTQILNLKAPYFFNPPAASAWRELWAQEFAFVSGNANLGPTVLPVSDTVIAQMRGGCSVPAVKWWNDLLTPPAAGGEYPNYCPAYSGTSWNH